jgi:hypothetical protein
LTFDEGFVIHESMRSRASLGLALLLLIGCATFDPKPIDGIPFKQRVQTQEKDGLTVSTTVLSAAEAKHAFGVNLEKTKVQAVWIRVDNRTAVPYNLMHHGVDPNYFSAAEVAYRHRRALAFSRNDRLDEHVERLSFQESIPPNASGEGFVFSNLKVGIKEVEIKLYGPARSETFEFYVSVPGSRADHYSVDWAALRDQTFDDLEDELAFRDALRALPCCTTRADGRGRGDPVNLVLIGSASAVFRAMIRAGWDQTEKLTAASAWRSAKAFFGGEYKHSPMSALYLFGRAQDAGFQKARSSIHQRNHLRLWLSPLRYRGEEVWVGTITRDIGVYFTTRAWNLMTHAIDPDVDEARRYLLEDLALGGFIDLWGPVRGVGAATREAPHRNLMNAPWWTDGNRLVMSIVEGPVPLEQHHYFFWDWPVPPGVDLDAFNRRLRDLVDEHRGSR